MEYSFPLSAGVKKCMFMCAKTFFDNCYEPIAAIFGNIILFKPENTQNSTDAAEFGWRKTAKQIYDIVNWGDLV